MCQALLQEYLIHVIPKGWVFLAIQRHRVDEGSNTDLCLMGSGVAGRLLRAGRDVEVVLASIFVVDGKARVHLCRSAGVLFVLTDLYESHDREDRDNQQDRHDNVEDRVVRR
eukprot:m.141231 g.141231  ORF g.141231 m.141231 type:complete len:112 (+) comp22851_c0_seq1:160-495(+)